MGIFTSVLGTAGGAVAGLAAEIAEQQRKLEDAKKGKSQQQKDVLDFFAAVYGKLGCLKKAMSVMDMEKYQRLVSGRLQTLNLRARAIEKIGLDESEISEIAPICLASYVFEDDCFVKVENGVAVSSQFSVTWIFFSATQMYTYQFVFDMTSDNTWETTRDYFYQDIVCFKTATVLHEQIVPHTKFSCFSGCSPFTAQTTYSKNNYTVDSLEITVPGDSYTFYMRDASGDQTNSIMAAKAMLRERKFVK